ncbi:MAG TPA: sulfatase-like hydrolase/transferase, partial [Candidatus Edwardsbacteria bacterium]|nr:sulfatase-like hydrolase/transferase [Candidatus Edwardsbacteria bacterium]
AAIVASMVRSPRETMLDPQYPFLRRRAAVGAPRRRNVVIFIMESWVTEQMGCYGAGTSCTPSFDSLARSGLLCTNFLANAQRSIEAAPAVLASIPGLSNNTQIGSTTETARLLGLGTILARRGYATAFYHGAKTGSMGFDAFARMAGFARYFGKEDYPGLSARVQDGVWGLYDEPAFLDACARADKMAQPFCLAIYSLNPHVPFAIPADRNALIPRLPGESEYQRALRYSDFALGRFFAAARATAWYDSTVFVIVGDHTTSPSQHDFRSIFLVPCLVLAPGLVQPGRTSRIASQVDLLPTVLDLLDLPATHAATGRSLLDTARSRCAVEWYGGRFALFTDSLLLLSAFDGNPGLYDYRRDHLLKSPLQQRDRPLADSMEQRVEAYLQSVSRALRNDRLCRSVDLRP